MEEYEEKEDEVVPQRRSRASGGRESSARSASARAPLAFGHMSRFFLPESVKADTDNEFCWAAFMIRGEDFNDSCNRAYHSGWNKLDPSKYPDLKRIYRNDYLRNRELESDAIRESGQMLLTRPAELGKEEKQYWRDKRASTMQGIQKYISKE
jgi:hypothetical protein